MQLPGKIDGAVRRLLATPEGLRAVHWKHVSAVSMEGCAKLLSMRAHLAEVLSLPALTVAVGEGELGVLSAGAKRAKYQPCPELGPMNAAVQLAADGGVGPLAREHPGALPLARRRELDRDAAPRVGAGPSWDRRRGLRAHASGGVRGPRVTPCLARRSAP